MHKWLYKILFVVISFSFFVSATEMDLGECHNTFFDEYDTYVKTEQVSFDNTPLQQHQTDTYAFLAWFIGYYKIAGHYSELSKAPFLRINKHSRNKIFLRNSVWRI